MTRTHVDRPANPPSTHASYGEMLDPTLVDEVLAKLDEHDTALDGHDTNQSYLKTAVMQPYVGSGADGALHFDGAAVVLGITPSSNVYTLTRDIQATTILIDSGVRVETAMFRVMATVSITGPGKVTCNGPSAVGATHTAATVGFYGTQAQGSDGKTGTPAAGVNGAAKSTCPPFWTTVGAVATNANGTGQGQGGGGGSAGANNGGTGGGITVAAATSGGYTMLSGWRGSQDTFGSWNWASSGGSGGLVGGTTGVSGGSGAGGGHLMLASPVLSGLALEAKGGDGGNATLGDATGAGGGGSGGGGVIDLIYWTKSGITTNVSGGTPGNGAGTGNNGGTGSAGTVLNWNMSGDGT